MAVGLAACDAGEREARNLGGQFDVVHSDALRFYHELVVELGDDPNPILLEAGVNPELSRTLGFALRYRNFVQLLALTADHLGVPDFGLRLADRQRGGRVIGPVGVVMKNSKTVGQALGYCAKHIHAYSVATRVRFRPNRAEHILFLGFEILLDSIADTRQVVEHALQLANLNIADITRGEARARRVHFRHEPAAPLATYRAHFGCEVLFGQAMDGLVLTEADLLCEIADPDEQVYEMATSFIDQHFPMATPPLHARVRGLISKYLGSEDCTSDHVAAELGMHPRTVQRHLRHEHTSFEEIKDEVRRDAALRYLQCFEMPLTQVAEKLGYAEASVLSRSCHRWFEASPVQIRRRAAGEKLVAAE